MRAPDNVEVVDLDGDARQGFGAIDEEVLTVSPLPSLAVATSASSMSETLFSTRGDVVREVGEVAQCTILFARWGWQRQGRCEESGGGVCW